MVREIRCLADRTVISMGSDRRKFTPWGLSGGKNAAGALASVTSTTGKERVLPTKVVVELRAGEILRVQTPGGGGWGIPEARAVTALEQDINDGFISKERAHQIYGKQ